MIRAHNSMKVLITGTTGWLGGELAIARRRLVLGSLRAPGERAILGLPALLARRRRRRGRGRVHRGKLYVLQWTFTTVINTVRFDLLRTCPQGESFARRGDTALRRAAARVEKCNRCKTRFKTKNYTRPRKRVVYGTSYFDGP